MAAPTSSLIIKKYDGFGGNFVDSQYLGAAYNADKPYVFENTLMKIYSSHSDLFSSKPMVGMTGGSKVGTTEIPSEVFRWTLQGAETKFATSLENLEAATPAPGLNNTTFRIKLNVDYYHAPDVLFSEDNTRPLAIMSGPHPDGTGNVYTVKIQTDDPTVYLPSYLMDSGREFSKVWTTVTSEMNDIYGTQQVPSSFLLESQLGYFANGITVTDKALRLEGRLGVDFIMTDSAGNERKVSNFMSAYEARMWDNFYREMEVQLIYGRKSTMPGLNKYWQKTGPGLREQLQDSWVKYYSGALSVNNLRDYLFDIFFTRNDESNRNVIAMTGTLGAMLFHQALANMNNGFLQLDTLTTEQVGTKNGTPQLATGVQYTRYRGINGLGVSVMINRMYDSSEFCKVMHPQYPNIPIDSARFTFLDFGMTKGKQNIMMVKQKDSFSHGVVTGLVGPNGPIQGGNVTSLKHSYDIGVQGSAGIVIMDVTRCGEYIYATND